MDYIVLIAGMYLLYIGLSMSARGFGYNFFFKFVPVALGAFLAGISLLKLFPSLIPA